jgi:hypothetical protein
MRRRRRPESTPKISNNSECSHDCAHSQRLLSTQRHLQEEEEEEEEEDEEEDEDPST